MAKYDSRVDIADFLSYLERAQRASVHTVKLYRKSLDLYRRHLERRSVGVRGASVEDVASWVESMSDNAPRTVKARLSAVKSFHRWLASTARASKNPADVVRAPRAPQPKRAALTPRDVELVRRSCPTLRQRVILALLYDCALRVSEAAGCLAADVDLERWQITVVGKGSKPRTVPIIGPAPRTDLSEWFARGEPTAFMLPSPQHVHDHLVPNSVHRLLGDAAEVAGFDRKVWHPHALRHARAEHLRAKGYEPFWLQRFLGHANLDHTARYVHPPIDPEDRPQAMPAAMPADLAGAIHALADALRPRA